MVDCDTKVHEQPAKQMPELKQVKLRMRNLHLHASGVFSNVYKGTLITPKPAKEIAIKKTWPERKEPCFEMIFLTGIGREKHKNIIQMLYVFCNKAKDGRICESYVFEFMPECLHNIIRLEGGVDKTDVKLYTWQMFNGLKYLGEQNIVHRDLKPVNILVDHQKGLLRIGDFGSAKLIEKGQMSTPYQVTRFYRPPELLLGSAFYDYSVDVWSAGCIVGEMVTGHVIFPGHDQDHQTKLVIAVLGQPTDADYKAMRAAKRVEKPKEPAKGIASLLPKAHAEVAKFLTKVLVYKPKERLFGSELLKDAFFEILFKPDTKRKSGQLTSEAITKEDYEAAVSTKPVVSRLAKLVKAKNAFEFEPEGAPSKHESTIILKNKEIEPKKHLANPMTDPEGVNERKRKNTVLKAKTQSGSSGSSGTEQTEDEKIQSISMAPAADSKSDAATALRK